MKELPGIDFQVLDATDEQIDVVYNVIDDMLFDRKFTEVNSILDSVKIDIQTLDITIMLSYLTITLWYCAELEARPRFYDRVSECLTTHVPDRAEALLRGLK